MLFNSFEFIFGFLPLAVLGFYLLARANIGLATLWLTVGSFLFYAWWDTRYLILLTGSIAFNFSVGVLITRASQPRGRRWLAFGITVNLITLGYFKYLDLLLGSLDRITGLDLPLQHLVLPIGISFFTFTQIAYLVDAHRGKVKEFRPLHYALFVTYFPHLIAGPVLHHADMMPQFAQRATYRVNWNGIAFGLTLFIVGLAKKVLIADPLSQYVGPVFDSPDSPRMVEAWGAALAYTCQLYFDFSGYSDMAVGLSRLFGIDLPVNFNSPYKAGNISEFWRRWHITLSTFLRDYLYIPLGGNRNGARARYVNLMITMTLGGLWHGAAWTFVLWGFLHGLYLTVNHAWQPLKRRLARRVDLDRHRSYRVASQALCFLAVVVGWVFFRAHSIDDGLRVLGGMFGANGWGWPRVLAPITQALGLAVEESGAGRITAMQCAYVTGALLIAFVAPNSMQILSALGAPVDDRYRRWAVASRLQWRLSAASAWILGLLGLACILLLSRAGEFLYFQF